MGSVFLEIGKVTMEVTIRRRVTPRSQTLKKALENLILHRSSLLTIKPIVAKTFPLAEAADALKYLVEKRPFGKVALTI